MKCHNSPDGVHRFGRETDRCFQCHAPLPSLRESQRQAAREPIRAKEGAGAYGRTAEVAAVDVARRRAGDDS
jgi:hypothetical protein